jgi:predicted RNase H-like HicB family nuclease
MSKLRAANGNGRRRHFYRFTVVLTPVSEQPAPVRRGSKLIRRVKNPTGYQVTVPMLPGVITYGRSEKEALEMARDAILCHIEGLRKSGEPIPDERQSHTETLRIAFTA